MGALIGHALHALETSLEKNAPTIAGANKDLCDGSNTLGGSASQ
jgi:hypothetical protein